MCDYLHRALSTLSFINPWSREPREKYRVDGVVVPLPKSRGSQDDNKNDAFAFDAGLTGLLFIRHFQFSRAFPII